ncbi:uncharacterized protein FTOL_13525 [Fusarium torulosum]|uniref:Uncharacterized protein n=1 Tax=Fusarium torulosum TaxID=33205 RepID=A0AAE8MMN0_9HYPO|nr:uncharacterized protein FTOL_13525 [Fusarium torulosum]
MSDGYPGCADDDSSAENGSLLMLEYCDIYGIEELGFCK